MSRDRQKLTVCVLHISMTVVIETDRLILREFDESDFDRWYEITSDPDNMSFWPSPFDRERATSWIHKAMQNYSHLGFGRYAVIEKESSRVIGDCGFFQLEILGKLENDLGYILDREFWGLGFATEAAKACLNYGVETLGMNRIVANMELAHGASKRVAEKVGLTIEQEFINERNRDKPTYLMVFEK